MCNHDWLAIGWRRSTRKLNRRLSGTHRGVRVERRVAPSDRPLRAGVRGDHWSVVWASWGSSVCRWQWCCGHYSGRDWRKTPLPESKIHPIGPAWSSDSTVKPQCQGSCRCFHALSVKAGATFTWFCLRVMSKEEISMPAKRWPTMLKGRFLEPLKL